jgi:SAM-dependent methyltransferase
VNSSATNVDYSGVTEVPGNLVSRDAASMAVSRYEIVRRLSAGKKVLEIGCGAGQGLSYVGTAASWVVGGDITQALLVTANAHYRGSIPLIRFDAHALPFADRSFDIVQIHEAIYYMERPTIVFGECRRVLRENGTFVLSSINPAWGDFNPSPHAVGYLDATQLKAAMSDAFRSVEIMFGFPVRTTTRLSAALSLLKRLAIRFRLMPKTMKGKTVLKRVFLGPLVPVPTEISGQSGAIEEPTIAPEDQASGFRIIYAVAQP